VPLARGRAVALSRAVRARGRVTLPQAVELLGVDKSAVVRCVKVALSEGWLTSNKRKKALGYYPGAVKPPAAT